MQRRLLLDVVVGERARPRRAARRSARRNFLGLPNSAKLPVTDTATDTLIATVIDTLSDTVIDTVIDTAIDTQTRYL